MTVEPASIRADHDLTAEQVDALEERLYAFNAGRTRHGDAAQLAFLAEVHGALIGAVAGFTWGGVCEIRQVWVDEAYRGWGVGEMLMHRAIREARDRSCACVFLATYDFQAPGFYAKLGFATVAEIRDKPLGHTEFVMRLDLGERTTALRLPRRR
jgi:N-acetylglutamate synthase-like GNAT family acetyltransferase